MCEKSKKPLSRHYHSEIQNTFLSGYYNVMGVKKVDINGLVAPMTGGRSDDSDEESQDDVFILVISSGARNLVVPDRAKVVMPPPAVISKRSEKSRVAEDAFLRADDGFMRSLPAVEMTAGAGREFVREVR